MKIGERIKHLQKSIKTHRWIYVYDNRAEYSPLDVGFFLEDADEYLKDNPGGVMDRELDTENYCTKDGMKCISLGFGNKDCGGRMNGWDVKQTVAGSKPFTVYEAGRLENGKGKLMAEIIGEYTENRAKITEMFLGDALTEWGFNKDDIIKDLQELQRYRDIGLTPEEFKETCDWILEKNKELKQREKELKESEVK